MDIIEATGAVSDYIAVQLKRKRREHSQRTADLSRELAPRYGIDPDAAYLAGLAHDMAKEMDEAGQRELAERARERRLREGRVPIPEFLVADPKLAHGPAAESVLRDELGLVDEGVLEAVSFHTSAGLGLMPLSYLVFSADKIEPERSWIDRSFRERCLSSTLNGMVLLILGRSIETLEASGKAIAPASLSLYNALRNGSK